MRTKALLLGATALAAGLMTSHAQVYSANIVGYVNVALPNGFSAVSVPLVNGAGDAMTNTIPNSGQLDGANLYVYNGHKFTVLTFDSTMPTGFGDASDSTAAPTPVVDPGTTFYINNNTGVALTNTFVGTVDVATLPGSVTNTLPAGYSFVSSVLPLGGGVSSVLNLTNNGALDGTQIYIPNIVSGSVHGYTTVTIDSGMTTGFGNASDTAPVAEPVIPVGTGFLYNNNAGLGPVTWVQTLNP